MNEFYARLKTLIGRPRRLLLLVVACCLPFAAASGGANEAGEKLVKDFLTDVVTMRGRFEQSLIDADGVVVEVSGGTLEIARPSRFRWVYAEPYEQWLVADGLNIWSYDVDLAQVTVKAQLEALSNTPALLLGGATTALEQFRFDGSWVEEATTWVSMRPVDDSSGFDRVGLGFVDGKLRQMVFHDNLEQTTRVALYDVVLNEPIAEENFAFAVPAGVDLVGIPLAASDADR